MVGAPDVVRPWMPRAVRAAKACASTLSRVDGARRRGRAAGGVSECFNEPRVARDSSPRNWRFVETAPMPAYADLDPRKLLGPDWAADQPARTRCVNTLLTLREALTAATPPRTPGTLLLGTWNLREFDSESWGTRLPESYAYIAEVIDRFDLVAVQEVRSDLRALEALLERLGKHWAYLVSDVTEGKAGNRERLAFLYDTTKVRLLGIAGELVLPPVSKGGALVPATQVARTPLMATFQVGWTKFVLATVHIIYGSDSPAPKARVEEIREVARFLKARTEDTVEPIRNLIVLGDFNIFTTGDATMRALIDDGGFSVP